MSKAYHVGRILLPPILVFEKREHGIYASGKALPFILEDLVAKGIGEIVVIDAWRYREVLDTLPRVFAKAIKLSESADVSDKIAAGAFGPFFEEFGIEASDRLDIFKRKPGSLATRQENEAIVEAGISAACDLALYLAAQREKSHCHFDISEMNKSVEAVANASRSPVSRANMAVLRGLFATYESIEHAAIMTQENSSSEMVKLFEELLDDATYQSLSHEVSKFGLREKAHDLKRNVSSLVRKIVDSKAGKRTIDFGATVITASTGVPVPKSDLAEALLSSSYVPPLVNLSESINMAKKKMLAAHPDLDFGGINRERSETHHFPSCGVPQRGPFVPGGYLTSTCKTNDGFRCAFSILKIGPSSSFAPPFFASTAPV